MMPARKVLPFAPPADRKRVSPGKILFPVTLTFRLPCGACHRPARVRENRRGKPYVACDSCGALLSITTDRALRELARRAKTEKGISLSAHFRGAANYLAYCRRLNRPAPPKPKPTCCQCRRPLLYKGRGRPPNNCAAAGLKCRPSLLRGES